MPLPESAPSPDRLLWYELRDLHREYKGGTISREQARRESDRAVMQWDRDKGTLDMAGKILQQNAKMWQDIELAAAAYNQDRTVEKADAFVQAVYGVRLRTGQSGEE